MNDVLGGLVIVTALVLFIKSLREDLGR